MSAPETTECRHDWKCEGWTVDPRTSICRVCGRWLVFWSELEDPDTWHEFVWPDATVVKL